MSIHAAQIEKGIGEIAVGLFRIQRDEGIIAYTRELADIVAFFTSEHITAMKMAYAATSTPFQKALDAVSNIGCSLAVDNDFKEGVEAAFPNCNEEMDHLEYKEAMRGKESE